MVKAVGSSLIDMNQLRGSGIAGYVMTTDACCGAKWLEPMSRFGGR